MRVAVLERYVEELTKVLADHAITPPPPPPGLRADARVEVLSEREQEVLTLVAKGLPNARIASELYVGVDTVKTHLQRVYRKIGVHNRAQAAVWYFSQAA
ncbi:LuxR C-terminal-related transcriptional regulator [Aquihabitans sp. G128]|uniref:response regulator transcription factor n=1 Tax=Aquihabitans sp. G128 TaxID=2849779 RepID=UPI001C24AE04|nr:LuxR C-terminal-related transcriptional regulator [Aquihabitans sp. G128]QXC60885.1 LuxR C-terminal-related transcriptional regulator [Aquihabitans sp. G128]